MTLGEWHSVLVSRTGRLGVLEVSGQRQVIQQSIGAFTQLSLQQNLYIGGIPNKEIISPYVDMDISFQGCIQMVNKVICIFVESTIN